MERLSHIMKATQRPYMPAQQRALQQQPAQGQHSPASLPHFQMEQQSTRFNNVSRTVGYYAPRSAPLAHVPALPEAPWDASAFPRSPLRTVQELYAPEQSRAKDAYGAEEYSTVVLADGQDDWDDDTASMRYGDWEEGFNCFQTSRYVAGDNSTVPASSSHPVTHQPMREIDAVAQRLAQIHSRNDSLDTHDSYPTGASQVREGRGAYRGVTHPTYPTTPHETRLLMSAPSTPAPQRQTQPLKPQQVGRAASEMRRQRFQASAVPQTPRKTNVDYTLVESSAPQLKPSVCSICHGAGYLRSNVAFGHPQFGKPVPCQCKEQERKRKRRQQLQELSNLGAFADKRFDTFTRQQGLQEAFQVSTEFAKNPDGWLLFIGPNGCGKTHLAAAIANTCLDAGAVVLFATVPDLLDHLRAAFAPKSDEVYDQLFARMREAEVLVLDDLGAQQSSPWANEKLFQLLNYRYNSGFPTVITANPKGLQATDDRIRSRLGDTSLVIKLNLDHAYDYRPRRPRRD